MISQHGLAKRFARGDEPASIRQASNVVVESLDLDDDYEAYIVGYNWAMYAARTSEGSVVVFEGWEGYSQSTTQQIAQIKSGARTAKRIGEVDELEMVDLRPKVRSKSRSESNQTESMHRHGRGV